MEVAAAGTSTVTVPTGITPISFLVCQGPASGVVTVAAAGGVTISSPGSASLVTYGVNVCLGFLSNGTNTYTAQVPGAPVSFGTGVQTALGVNVGTAGSPVVNGGALGTPSSGTGTNITGIVNNNVSAALTAIGSSTGNTLTGPREYFICTAGCTVTPPVPVAGYEFCIYNDDNTSGVIVMGALGSSALYEKTARTGYGTAGTGTMTSGGAVGDKVCLHGRDATHYEVISYTGVWTNS
jgi:hypothetical protein